MLQKTFGPQLFPRVSIYIKRSPIGGICLAPVIFVKVFVFDDLMEIVSLSLSFLSLHFIFHCCNKYPPLFGYLTKV